MLATTFWHLGLGPGFTYKCWGIHARRVVLNVHIQQFEEISLFVHFLTWEVDSRVLVELQLFTLAKQVDALAQTSS